MQIENLSRPGQAPAAGDYLELAHSNGAKERKYYFPDGTKAAEARKNEIRQRLSAIDAETGSSRALREAIIDLLPAGKGSGLRSKETEAAALRAELATV